MAIDLYELDAIRNYKKAIAALEGYADKIIDDFLDAPEGQSYIQANPDEEEYVGEWFLTVLTLTYKTEVVTLPHITPNILEPILTQTLPSTLAPDEAADAGSLIPELIAFWSYLQRAYRLSTALDIIRCLRSIQPIFNALVVGDTSSTKRPAKSSNTRQPASSNNRLGDQQMSSLVHSLDALGDIDIDDIDENDLEELEDLELEDLDEDWVDRRTDTHDSETHHLDHDANGGSHHHGRPASLVDMDVDRGITRPISKAESASTPKSSGTASGKLTMTSDPVPTSHLVSISDNADSNGVVQSNENGRSPKKATVPPLSESSVAILTQQAIAEDFPGTILHDFQVFLDAVSNKGIVISSKTQYVPTKILAAINANMRDPVQLDLKRPLQKHYPNIHGLYLLLKASGLGSVAQKGKKYVLQQQPELVTQWRQFNPTEKYFALLNAWMVRSTSDMIGDQHHSQIPGLQCVEGWFASRVNTGNENLSSDGLAKQLGQVVGWHNLALMHLFGLVTLTTVKPNTGQGWHVTGAERSPLGKAIMEVVQNYHHDSRNLQPPHSPVLLNELQPMFQPYFPEWQQSLAIA